MQWVHQFDLNNLLSKNCDFAFVILVLDHALDLSSVFFKLLCFFLVKILTLKARS